MDLSYEKKRFIIKNYFVYIFSWFLIYYLSVNTVVSDCINLYPSYLTTEIQLWFLENIWKLINFSLVNMYKIFQFPLQRINFLYRYWLITLLANILAIIVITSFFSKDIRLILESFDDDWRRKYFHKHYDQEKPYCNFEMNTEKFFISRKVCNYSLIKNLCLEQLYRVNLFTILDLIFVLLSLASCLLFFHI